MVSAMYRSVIQEEQKYSDLQDEENQYNSNTHNMSLSKLKCRNGFIHKEIRNECCSFRTYENFQFITNSLQHFFHLPYFPILSRPGWLLR